MASATGIPNHLPDNGAGESEPLLGQPGDVLQKEDESMFKNLYSGGPCHLHCAIAQSFSCLENSTNTDCSLTVGTAWIAQAGSILLVVLVWTSVFLNPLIPLFSPHPLLQSVGVLAVTQAILILQPTWTGDEKIKGARAHASLNLLSFLIFAAGVLIIETNKVKAGPDSHFHSVHGYLGVITSFVLLAQYVVGFLMWGVPSVFGGIDNAKALYKYHRMNGYLLYLLLLACVISATQTPYNWNVLGIKLWAVAVLSGMIVVGVYPRIHTRKLGFLRESSNSGSTVQSG